jgi:hypothetical protein
VLKMFPELFEEIAKKDNIIDWASSFKNSPKLQRFVYQTLIEEDNAFNEFLNVAKLKNELDAFFLASPSPEHPITGKNKVKTRAIRTLEKFPVVYNLTHRTFYFANKWLGNSIDPLPTEQLIIRLLILKVWANLFLS